MSKAFKNNMSPGVPKMKGFSPKTPGVVAAMPSKQPMPSMKPHTLAGSMGKTKMPR